MLTPALVRRRENSDTDGNTETSGNICATLSLGIPLNKNKTGLTNALRRFSGAAYRWVFAGELQAFSRLIAADAGLLPFSLDTAQLKYKQSRSLTCRFSCRSEVHCSDARWFS